MLKRFRVFPNVDGGYHPPRPDDGPAGLAIVVGLVRENRRLRAENDELSARIAQIEATLAAFREWTPEERLQAAYQLGRRDERYAAIPGAEG